MSKLLPCPFCAGGETQTSINRLDRAPSMLGKESAIISVEIHHWCEPIEGQPRRNVITRIGRDMDSAIAAWNRRAPGTVTVTREEVARAISEVFAEAAGGCLNIQDAESPDDCADGGCPCMSITNQAADAILALLNRGIAS